MPDRTDQRKQVIYGGDHYRVGTADDHNGYAVNKANAQLLISAPDLLEALKRIEWHAASEAPSEELEDAQGDLRRIYEEARAAIAKALGTPTA